MAPRRVLVTGAAGFVGTHLRRHLATRWPAAEVTALGLPGPDPEVVAADMLDAPAIEAAVAKARPHAIFHLAGQASVARGAADAALTWSVNLTGTLNLANAVARHAPEAILLFASSSEVYGASFLDGPVSERTELRPLTAYARSKAMGERVLAEVLAPTTRLIVARPFNHTGPGQAATFVLPSFAAQIARIEAGLQPPRLAVGNLDVARDFLDVRDVIEAYALLVEAVELPARFTCNIASGAAHPLRDRVEALRALACVPFEIAVDPSRLRAVDVPSAVGDAALLRGATGWAPRVPIAETLAGLLDAARAAVASSGADGAVTDR